MNMPVFRTYIASKGRAGTCHTARLLAGKVPFMLVVEPGEAEAYSENHPSGELVVLPRGGMGLPFARNFILEHARSGGGGWFWMLDDDITKFYVAGAGKCRPADAGQVLGLASARASGAEDVAQVSLEYQQFAWSATREMTRNSYCDVAVAIHAGRCGAARFRDEVTLKVDRDFTLQLLSSGWGTVRFNRLAFACPKNGTNPGGNSGFYETDSPEESSSRKMVELWGGEICRLHRKSDGRPDVKINWGFFRR